MKRLGVRLCKQVAKYGLLPFGFLVRLFCQTRDEIIILMYHRVNDQVEQELAVRMECFKWQMEYLKRHQYRILTLDEAAVMIREQRIKGKWIVLTFDDGYEDFYHQAFPVLQQYNLPSLVYLVPGYIETNRVFWWDRESSPLLNWDQIKKLAASGLVTFGSHSLEHYDMDRLSSQQIVTELEESKRILENRLDRPVEHFSYPRGRTSPQLESLVSQVYQTGVLMFNGSSVTNRKCGNQHCFTLKRTAIQRSDRKWLFVAKIEGWLICVEGLRRIWWNLRHKQ